MAQLNNKHVLSDATFEITLQQYFEKLVVLSQVVDQVKNGLKALPDIVTLFSFYFTFCEKYSVLELLIIVIRIS